MPDVEFPANGGTAPAISQRPSPVAAPASSSSRSGGGSTSTSAACATGWRARASSRSRPTSSAARPPTSPTLVGHAKNLEREIANASGQDVHFDFYEGGGHAFFNDTNRLGTYHKDHADLSWQRTIAFLHSNL